MTEFRQLDRLDQLRRLRGLAQAALATYNLDDVALELLHYGANAIYRVTRLRDRSRFVLRIHTPQTSQAHIRSELAWLDALNDDGFTVPRPIAGPGGDGVLTVAAPDAPEKRDCTLLTWMEGRVARKRRTPEQVRRIGRQIARLHRHAARFHAPRGFTRPRWDPASLLESEGWQRLTASQFRLFQQVADRFQSAASDLGGGKEVFGVIHSDFTFDNVLFHRGEVRVIDFDDCGSGYYLYDIATLLDRMEWREDYCVLRTALLLGYREERTFPAEHEALLDLFLLTRWTFLGLAFLSAPEHSPGRVYSDRFLKIVAPKMRKYLRMPA